MSLCSKKMNPFVHHTHLSTHIREYIANGCAQRLLCHCFFILLHTNRKAHHEILLCIRLAHAFSFFTLTAVSWRSWGVLCEEGVDEFRRA